MNQLDVWIYELAKARKYHAEQKETANKAIDDFKRTDPAYNTASQNAQNAAETIAELEKAIKEYALEQYKLNGAKSIHDKVNVRIFKVFNLTNPQRVLSWVKNNLVDALIFDEKKVKNYAMKIGAIDGIEITEEPKAQIASDL